MALGPCVVACVSSREGVCIFAFCMWDRSSIARYEAALAKATKALTRTDVATLSPEDAAWRDALAVQVPSAVFHTCPFCPSSLLFITQIQTFREDMVKGGVDEKKEGEKGEKEEAEVKGEEASVAFPAEPPAVLSVGDKEEGELPVEVKAATAASLDPLSFPHFVTDAMNGSRSVQHGAHTSSGANRALAGVGFCLSLSKSFRTWTCL